MFLTLLMGFGLEDRVPAPFRHPPRAAVTSQEPLLCSLPKGCWSQQASSPRPTATPHENTDTVPARAPAGPRRGLRLAEAGRAALSVPTVATTVTQASASQGPGRDHRASGSTQRSSAVLQRGLRGCRVDLAQGYLPCNRGLLKWDTTSRSKGQRNLF